MATESRTPALPTAERLQDYLRATVERTREPVRVPPFTAYLDPADDLSFLNYAIPDAPPRGRRIVVRAAEEAPPEGDPLDPVAALGRLADAFRARGRRLRFEFLEECYPDLPARLRRAGLEEELRTPLLGCTRASWLPAPAPPGLTLEAVLPSSPWPVVRAFLLVQREAFGLADEGVAEDAPAGAWATLGIGAGVLARLDGMPVGAGGFTPPADGLCELVGIATAPRARRRGVAGVVTSALARAAHETGVEVAFLAPGDAASQRVYERAGFAPCATLLAYREPRKD